MTKTMQNEKAAELVEKARECEQRSRDSFDRCDTDGFLSQWASDITARKYRAQADIEERGGCAWFPALYDLDGRRVKARLLRIANQFAGYGTRLVWVFDDSSHKPVTAHPKRVTTMARKGFAEGSELAPAEAYVGGEGTGLAGATSAYVATRRTDGGYPADAIAAPAA